MQSKIRLGIVGAGRLGGFHADKAVAHPDIALSTVYDAVPEQARKLAEKHGITACGSLEEMYEAVDAVVIAGPTVLHRELGYQFLKRGIHVLMEKPMTPNVREAKELLAAENESGCVFQVGHVEQFNPAWTAAESVLAPIRNGRKAFIEARRTSGYTFRSVDVGAVLDLMIHDLDLVLSTIRSELVSVEAIGFRYLGGYEDTASAILRFENGSLATLYASRVEKTAVRNMRIRTEDVAAEIDFGSRTFRTIRPDAAILAGEFSPERVSQVAIPEIVKTFMDDHFESSERTEDAIDALALEMEDFARAIIEKTPPQVPGSRAIRAVELAEQIMRKCEG